MLWCFFDIPAVDAARALKVFLTVLKNMRRWVGLKRWSYALVNSGEFQKLQEGVVELLRSVIARLEGGCESLAIRPGSSRGRF